MIDVARGIAGLARLEDATRAAPVDGTLGVVIRVFQPDAADCYVGREGVATAMRAEGDGFFQLFLPGAPLPLRYTLRFLAADGRSWERGDPYRFAPTVGEMDLHLFNEGTHRRLWTMLGAHPRTIDGDEGTAFVVWAPNAARVSVIGDWCNWDGRQFPMRRLGSSGLWDLFIPGVGVNAVYKFELRTRDGDLRVKTDPLALKMEQSPATGSIVVSNDRYHWKDDAWMTARPTRNLVYEPVHIYEVHLGSWARVPEEGGRFLSYREIAPRLAEHVQRLGFTHIELLPVMEHPFYGSWGYQTIGYYAPTRRYGEPDDFMAFVDHLHQRGIGVILDWVPAHFPQDPHGLAYFDGTHLYEHSDPRLREHPDWGTRVFNYGRTEVANFLIGNALFWLDRYHLDGLRVDAVASMLYLDYSRKPGEWIPNVHGGRENLEAIAFVKRLNEVVYGAHPDVIMVAEESTSWPQVSRPVYLGGLGFGFKWNMGWMHDVLDYLRHEPVHRKFHHNQLTFGMLYAWSENFVLPLSHDEVVHGKGSLIGKMPGDEWQRFANLRLLYGFMWAYPGKKLLFMGGELGQSAEWNHDRSLDWHLLEAGPYHRGLQRLVADLNRLYRGEPALHEGDADPAGFRWMDCSDADGSVVAFCRFARDERGIVLCAANFTPVVREGYRIGVPRAGYYVEAVNTDSEYYGGGNVGNGPGVRSEPIPCHGQPWSVSLTLPPLGALLLRWAGP